MKVKILSGVALEGGTDAFAEDVVEVSEDFGRHLIRRGKAVEASGETPKKPTKK